MTARDPEDAAWVGIDLGTQSVRALVAGSTGQVLGRGSAPLGGHRSGNRHEQRPEDWWTGVAAATRTALGGLPRAAPPIGGVAVCGTSGTVLLTGADGTARTAGIMYDDARAGAEAAEAQRAGASVWDRLGHRIQPSWALAKALWLVRHHAAGSGRAAGPLLAHQPDVVTRRLAGTATATDSSHALKTGYDLLGGAWPDEVFAALGLPPEMFPQVVRPGTVLGEVCAAAAEETGLPAGTPIVAGMTDGCAAQLGAGTLREGHWNCVLGTTLVLKGVTAGPVRDPAGVVYSHRSPDGHWLPGGASSVGAGALTAAFPRAGHAELAALDARAEDHEPAGALTYPLVSPGERFPFLAPEATPFTLGTPAGDADRHAAILQGVALVERLCLAYVRHLGAPVTGPLTFTGGAARSAYWCRLRADITGRPARIPESAEPALGMAVLAAYGAGTGRPLPRIAERMVRIRTRIEPRPDRRARFAEPYTRLVDELERRGWLPSEVAAYARERG